MSSTSQNRPYHHPVKPSSAASLLSQSSVININGNPIEAAFEAQRQSKKDRAIDPNDHIDKIFPRCQPPDASAQSKGSKGEKTTRKNINTNGTKKRAGSGKKKAVSKKLSKRKSESDEMWRRSRKAGDAYFTVMPI